MSTERVRRGLLLFLARALGEEEMKAALGGDPRCPSLRLDGEALGRLRRLAGARLEHLRRWLVAEAAASDDVHDLSSALRYLRERLQDLSPVLTPEDIGKLWEELEGEAQAWLLRFDREEGGD